MSTSASIAVPSLVLAIMAPWALAQDGPQAEIEMLRQERERAATVTTQDVERFIGRTRWALEDGTEARITVHAAGNSGKKEFRPVLKRAAEAWSKAGYSSLTFYALHNLWKLGEPPEYFLENVRAHKLNPELALRSALVWGRDATEGELSLLERVADEAPRGSPIRNYAYPLVQHAVYLHKQYATLTSIDQKVDMVLRCAGRGFNVIAGAGGDPMSSDYPEVDWARRELMSLCKQDPELVARHLLATDPHQPKGHALYDARWDYLAQFLDDKAVAAYRRLKLSPADVTAAGAKEAGNRK